MLYTLTNELLTVTVSDYGAEVVSITRRDDGCEYIWQGDDRFWTEHAPWLFPICSNLYQKKYTYEGKTYEMGLHGFARFSVFEAKQTSDTSVTFTLTDSEATRTVYPFAFSFNVTYTLKDNHLCETLTVTNCGDGMLPFSLGAHPGFAIPFGDKGAFEDYYLCFPKACYPDEIVLGDTLLNTGRKRAYPLDGARKLHLERRMFAIDGVFLDNVPHEVTLMSDTSERRVTLQYPDMPYLGMWSSSDPDCHLICVEPWYGLPSYENAVDDFATKNDMLRLLPHDAKTFDITLILE